MQLTEMSERKAGDESGGFHRWTSNVRETPKKREVKNISEVEFNRFERLPIGESIEGFVRGCFKVSNQGPNVFQRGFVQHSTRSPDQQTNIFVKLDFGRREFHCSFKRARGDSVLHQLAARFQFLPKTRRDLAGKSDNNFLIFVRFGRELFDFVADMRCAW